MDSSKEKNEKINETCKETADKNEPVNASPAHTEEKADTAGNAENAENCHECDKDEKDGKKDKKSSEKEAKKLKSRITQLEKELEAAKSEAADATDKYMRVCAEYDNFRKRSQKEREGIYSDAAADSIKELLPLIDNLERATQYTNPEKVAEGVEMVLSTLPAVFEKLKITSFGEAGETFDPNIHNAVMHVEDEEKGEGKITDVFQKGYKIGDKVVRYAMVKVAN